MSQEPLRIENLIEKPLWDDAGWRQTVFLVTPDLDQQPGIALQFKNTDAANLIFDGWRQKFGGFADRRDRLRICIVAGNHPTKGEGFTTLISTDSTPPPGEPLPTAPSYFVAGIRSRFQSTDEQRQSHEWFRSSLHRRGSFFVVPTPILSDGEIVPDVSRCVVKTRIYFRTFDEVIAGGEGDLDALAIS